MRSDSHSVVVLISVQAILPHCGSLLGSLVMTARRPSVAVRGQGAIGLTALGLTILAQQSLVIKIPFKPLIMYHCGQCRATRVCKAVFDVFKLTLNDDFISKTLI